MTNRLLYILSAFLLLIACGKEGKPDDIRKPVMRLSLIDSTDVSATVSLQTLNASASYLMCLAQEESVPEADVIVSNGIEVKSNTYQIKDLIPDTKYTIYAVCINGPQSISSVYKRDFKTKPGSKPSISLSFDTIQDREVTISVSKRNAQKAYATLRKLSDSVPEAETIISEGIEEKDGKITITGLRPNTKYVIYGVGIGGNEYSKIVRLSFTSTLTYTWETTRTQLLDYADLDLLPGGISNKTPKYWDEDRLQPHVTFIDESGKEHWLHEAFLFIGGVDDESGSVLCITDGKNISADQSSWKRFADYWLCEGGTITALDKTIANSISRIGTPSFKHKIVMTMPDPIMLEYFYDKNSSTTYWGAVNGRQLDFTDTDDQVLAYKWYIDYIREQWAMAAPEHLELAGFYILSEILVAKANGWNYKYKRWDKIIPYVSDYLHEKKYTLNWIPYYQADGYDMTTQLGIDYTWLQPNKYWDYPEKKQKKSWTWVFSTMNTYGHGMEIEFEGSHGEPGWSQYEADVARTSSSILETVRTDNDAQGTAKGKPNPQAARNKQLLRDYMEEFKKAGYYGKARIATYSGTNAMYELATSPDEADRQMYL